MSPRLRRATLTAVLLGGMVALADPPRPDGQISPAGAADPAWNPAGFARVDVAPTRTSIYIGTVSMTMATFERRPGAYESTYVAKVFPYFFYNEHGTLTIDLADAALRRLAAGEAVEFSGRAINSAREERRVEGKATPADARSGKLKVRVFVSKRIELIFNSTYRFPAMPPAESAAGSPSSPGAVPAAVPPQPAPKP